MDVRDKIWICFLNDDNSKVEGYFIKLSETSSYIKIEDLSGRNRLTIPFHRVLKVKENIELKGGSNKN